MLTSHPFLCSFQKITWSFHNWKPIFVDIQIDIHYYYNYERRSKEKSAFELLSVIISRK